MNGLSDRLNELSAPPPTPGAAELTAAGLAHHRAGRVREALACYADAVARDPVHFVALHMAGVAHQQCGDSEPAVDLIRRAIAVAPDDPAPHGNLAVAYLSLGRRAEAEACVRRALALRPDWDLAHLNLGNVLQAMGRTREAEGAFRRAIDLNANSPAAWAGLGGVLSKSGRADAALDCYRRAVELDPANAGAFNGAGTVHQMRGEWPQAVECFRRAVDIAPGFVEALCNLAGALRRSGNTAEALDLARRALAIGTDDADALANLASVLIAVADLPQAEACCSKALERNPAHVASLVASGTLCKMRGDLPGAQACLRRALDADPASAAAQYNLAMIELARGDYAQGFAHFEGRFAAVEGTPWDSPRIREFLRDDRRWRGEPLAGRRLLVWGEQGYGDVIMMLRYLPMLTPRGAGSVRVQCEPALVRLAQAVTGIDDAVPDERRIDPGAFDLHCPMMSLPMVFGTTYDAVPAPVPYVVPPASLVRRFGARLSAISGLKVGVCWTSGSKLAEHLRRNVPLRALEPLFRADAPLVSLQKGEAAADAAAFGGALLGAIDDCRDFLDTAALVANLDLVISVDTAVAHLAGAMGKPVWLLNRHEGDWRWGVAGEASVWYPSMRIFRQTDPVGWDAVVSRVAAELLQLRSRDRPGGAR